MIKRAKGVERIGGLLLPLRTTTADDPGDGSRANEMIKQIRSIISSIISYTVIMTDIYCITKIYVLLSP